MISQSVSKQFNQLECLPKVVHTTILDSKSEANMLRHVHIKSTLAQAITDYPVDQIMTKSGIQYICGLV